MPASTKYPVLRQTLIVLAFIGLMGLFFALNLLIFIPRQQQSYHNKVFRVLKEITRDFESSLQGKADFIARNQKRPPDTSVHLKECEYKTISRNLFKAFDTLQNTYVVSDYYFDYKFSPDTAQLFIRETNKDTSVKFHFHEVLKPSIETLHKDEFDLVLLIDREKDAVSENRKTQQVHDRILYLYGELSASYVIPGDTLFKDARFAQFSSIIDVPVAGTNYKAFTLPFKLKDKNLLMIGFVNGKKYTITTSSYSLPVVLWILTLFTILILSLPIVKIYLSSRKERLNTNDVRMLMVVFIAMPFIVVLITLTLLIYRSEDNATTENLKKLHSAVQQNFSSETREAILQLKAYDSIIADEKQLSETFCKNKNSIFLNDSNADFRDILFYPARYKNLDDIFWLNNEGQQIAKWFFTKEKVSYLDVSRRNYFKKMKQGQGFVSDTDAFYIEPTISWATGKYSVNVLTTSKQKFPIKIDSLNKPTTHKTDTNYATMIALAGKMYSVCDPVVPKGYQFCITNTEGQILFHSQAGRSLHENLIEESNNNAELAKAIANKENVLIPDVELYEKHTKMLVSSVQGMPEFFLVSYFNKREQNLFVFHITAFTLLCTLATLFGVLILILLYYFFGKKVSGRRFKSYDSALIKPSEQKQIIYQQNIVQQVGLVVLFLVLFLFILVCRENHYWFLLQSSVVFPFLAVTGYILHRDESKIRKAGAEVDKAQRKQESSFKHFLRRHQRVLIIHFISILFVLFTVNFFQETKYRMVSAACILLFVASPVLLAWIIRNSFFVPTMSWVESFRLSYIANYTLLISLTIFSISVLPTLGIASFALHEEEQMKTKARQFYIASTIESRADLLNTYFTNTKLRNHKEDSTYRNNRKYAPAYGIYLQEDTMETQKFANTPDVNHSIHSHFYQAITRFLFLPKDHTEFFEDNPTYFWHKSKGGENESLTLVYRNDKERGNDNGLKIYQSRQSANLPPAKFSYAVALIILSVLTFFVFHFFVIQAISRKIFLLDYFDFKTSQPRNQKWMDDIFKTTLSKEDRQRLRLNGEVLNSNVITGLETESREGKIEERLLQIQYVLSPAYEVIWQKLSTEAQFVLYDFALDGFANYKNVDIVYALYQKGLLVINKEQQLQLMTNTFRSFLLGKEGTDEILLLDQKFSASTAWKNLKNLFFVLLFAMLIFMFATQQDVSNKILAIVSGLATLVPVLLKLFDRNISSSAKSAT